MFLPPINWPAYANSGLNESCPAVLNDPAVNYGGRDLFFQFNSGNFEYVSALSRETNQNPFSEVYVANFNIYTSCDLSSKLPVTEINGAPVYQLSPNTTYFVQRLRLLGPGIGYDSDQDGFSWQMDFFEDLPDFSCSGSQTITLNSSNAFRYSYDLPEGTETGNLYFKVTLSEDRVLESSSGDIFTGTCSSLTPNTSQVLRSGEIYTIKSNFEYFRISTAERAINDEISGATSISLDQDVIYNSRNFSRTPPVLFRSGFYSFVAPVSGAVVIYGGNGSDQLILDNPSNQIIVSPWQENFFLNLTPGQTYYLQKHMTTGFNDQTFRIEEYLPAVSNTICSEADGVLINSFSQTGNFLYAPEHWYKIQGLNNPHNLTFVSTSSNPFEVTFYNGNNCVNQVEFAHQIFNSAGQSFEFLSTPNKVVRMKLSSSSGAITDFSFRVNGSIISGSVPANNNCAGAELFIPKTSIRPPYDFSLATPDNSGIPSCFPNNDNEQLPTLWYEATFGEETYWNIGKGITVYEGSCSNLTPLACFSDEVPGNLEVGVAFEPNTTYILSANLSADQRILLTKNFDSDSNCENPELINLNTGFEVFDESNLKAYDILDPAICASSSFNDAWYQFQIPSGSNAIELTADKNVYFNIYSGSCESLSEIECFNLKDNSRIVELPTGIEYYLRLSLPRSQQRGDVMYRSIEVLAENDVCLSSSDIEINNGPTELNKQGEFNSTPTNTCNPTVSDVYYKMTPSNQGIIVVESDEYLDVNTEYFVELYDFCGGTVFQPCSSGSKVVFTGLTENKEYILRTNASNSDVYSSQVYSPEPAGANKTCVTAELLSDSDFLNPIEGYSYTTVDGVFYKFIKEDGISYELSTDVQFEVTVYTGGCGELVEYGSFDIESNLVVEGVPPGTEVLIKIESDFYYNFLIERGIDQIPPISFCEYAEDYGSLEQLSCTAPLLVNLPLSSFGPTTVWYSFVPSTPAVGVSLTEESGLFSSITSFRVHDACGGNIIFSSRGAFDSNISNLIPGNQYFIEIVGAIDQSEITTNCAQSSDPNCRNDQMAEAFLNVELCVFAYPPPAINDECSDAISLSLSSSSCNAAISGNTNAAYDAKFNCQNGLRELWYQFQASDNVNLKINVLNNTKPIILTIFDGDCLGQEIVCNTDSAIIVMQETDEILIAVSPISNNDNTAFDLCISELSFENADSTNVGIDVEDPITKLQVLGSVAMSNSNIPFPGSIRFNGTDLEGFTSKGWQSLTTINEPLTNFQDDLGSHIAMEPLNMSGFPIEQLPNPINPGEAVNKAYLDDQLEQIRQTQQDTSSTNSGIENVFLQVNPFDSEIRHSLEVESTSNNFSVNLDRLFGGWLYQKNGNDEYTWADMNVGIKLEEPEADLHIARNTVTRFQGSGGNVIDLTTNNEDLLFDFNSTAQGQPSPHFKLGTFLAQGSSPSFDFDVRNGRLGIDVNDPQRALDMNGTLQVKRDSDTNNPHLNIIETTSGYSRIKMSNSTNEFITIAARPSTTTDNALLNFYIDGAGDVMTVKGNEMVGINDATPTKTLEVNAQSSDDPLIVRTGTTEHLQILENGHLLIGNNVVDNPDQLIRAASGAHLTTGGAWTNASSRDLKHNFESVVSQDILVKLAALNILKWNYKLDSSATHLGPIAEEFYETFGLGGNDKSISTVDASGVALAAIQALYDESKTAKETSEKLVKENEDLKKENEDIKLLLEKLVLRIEALEKE